MIAQFASNLEQTLRLEAGHGKVTQALCCDVVVDAESSDAAPGCYRARVYKF